MTHSYETWLIHMRHDSFIWNKHYSHVLSINYSYMHTLLVHTHTNQDSVLPFLCNFTHTSTLKHTHTYSLSLTHTHTYTNTPPHTHTHSHKQTHTHKYTHAHTHTYPYTHTGPPIPVQFSKRSPHETAPLSSNTHTHTHTLTNTRTQKPTHPSTHLAPCSSKHSQPTWCVCVCVCVCVRERKRDYVCVCVCV